MDIDMEQIVAGLKPFFDAINTRLDRLEQPGKPGRSAAYPSAIIRTVSTISNGASSVSKPATREHARSERRRLGIREAFRSWFEDRASAYFCPQLQATNRLIDRLPKPRS